MEKSLKVVARVNGECWPDTGPSFLLITPTKSWLEKIFRRIELVADLQRNDCDLVRMTYDDEIAVYFNEVCAKEGYVITDVDQVIGQFQDLAIVMNFVIPGSTEATGLLIKEDGEGEIYCDLNQVLIDKDSVIFRASVENDLSYCYSPEIMLSDLKDWYLMLS